MDKRVILLVEDNPDDVELTMRALTQNRIRNPVIVAADGVEALDYLFCRGAHKGRDPSDVPALVLLDLKLPRVNGLAVLTQVRESELTRMVPVVILTSSKEEQDLLHAYLLGCNGYVRKPVKFEQLSAAVGQLGLFWLLINEPPPMPGRDVLPGTDARGSATSFA